jgi:MBG domain-containing protein/Big-like domain-containing protein
MGIRCSVAGGAAALVVTVLLGIGAPAASAATCPTLNGTPVGSSYTVPASGVSQLDIQVYGQAGQDWVYTSPNDGIGPPSFDAKGGLGSTLEAELAVTPGEVFQAGTLPGGSGGPNGVTGNPQTELGLSPGGNGGSAQYITVTPPGSGACTQVVAVAAGGGGAGGGLGGYEDSDQGGSGGNADAGSGATGGGDAGQNGQDDGGHGGPATASGGGSGGSAGHSLASCRDGNPGSAGGFESGGGGAYGHATDTSAGGFSSCSPGFGGGGGGGGYYYGGGGGGGFNQYPSGGGGGGSSYLAPGTALVPGSLSFVQEPTAVGTWAEANDGEAEPSLPAVPTGGGALPPAPSMTPVIDTALTLASSASLPALGQAVTFTATVSTIDPASQLGVGTVTFDDGNTTIGQATLVLAPGATPNSGTASFTTAALPEGTDHISASFGGAGGSGFDDRPTVAVELDQSVTPAITFSSTPPAGAQAFGATYVVSATDSSNLPVDFSIDSSASSVCTISGATVSFIAGGKCVIDAEQFATTAEPFDVEAQQVVTVAGPIAQKITFTSTAPNGVTPPADYTVSATGGASGNPVTFSTPVSDPCDYEGTGTNIVQLQQGGTCHIFAHQDGGNGYAPGDAEQDVTIGETPDTIIFFSTPPTDAVPGDQYALSAVTQEFDPVAFSLDPSSVGCTKTTDQIEGSETLSTITFTGVGTCVIDASTPGRPPKFSPATAQQTILVKTAQAISFTSPAGQPNPTYGGSYSISATGGGSGNPVTFTSLTTAVCTVSGGTVSFVAHGFCQVEADEGGNAAFAAAPKQFSNIEVAPAPLTVVPPTPSYIYGAPVPANVTPVVTGFVHGDKASSLPTPVTCAAEPGARGYIVADSPYEMICTSGTEANYVIGAVIGTLTITPAPLTITAPPAGYEYGAAVPASFTPGYSGFVPGESVSSLSSPATCAPTGVVGGVGSYTISCSGAVDSNYAIRYVDSTLSITQGELVVTAPSASYAYGTRIPASVTPTYSGFVPGDSAASLQSGPSCGPNVVGSVGSFAFKCSGAVDPNYDIKYVSGQLSITPVPLSVAAPAESYADGSAIPSSFPPNYSGFVAPDGPGSPVDVPAAMASQAVCAPTAPVAGPGVYTIACSGAVDPNYVISYTSNTLTITPAPGEQVITGTVTDAGGGPAANVCVYPYDASTGDRTSDLAACTDSSGAYTLSVAAAGSYDLVFYDPTGALVTEWYGGRYESQATPVSVSSGSSTPGIDAVMASAALPGTSIAGAVTTAGGAGIANVCVYPYAASTGDRTADPAACTNSEGVYTLSLGSAGAYNLVFYDASGAYLTQWYGGASFEDGASAVSVTDGTPRTGIDAVLASSTAAGTSITGKVTDATGTGIPNICVYPFDAATTDRTNDAAACTDAAGDYTLRVARAGAYNVVFYDGTGVYVTQWYEGAQYEGGATPVSVAVGAPTANIDATLAASP